MSTIALAPHFGARRSPIVAFELVVFVSIDRPRAIREIRPIRRESSATAQSRTSWHGIPRICVSDSDSLVCGSRDAGHCTCNNRSERYRACIRNLFGNRSKVQDRSNRYNHRRGERGVKLAAATLESPRHSIALQPLRGGAARGRGKFLRGTTRSCFSRVDPAISAIKCASRQHA